MKKILIAALSIMWALNSFAAEPADSCLVYGYLWWSAGATKYSAKIELGPGSDRKDIISPSGDKLKFASFLNAINYMSSQGWEIIEVSKVNPYNSTITLAEQYAIIRRKMSADEATPYCSPKQ